MKRIKITLELEVPDSDASRFHLDLIKRMHKYLSKWACTVFAVDSEVQDATDKVSK